MLLLDVRGVCSYADYFVLLSAETRRQTNTIVEDVAKEMKDTGVPSLGREGTAEAGWILMDFGDVIVHVFGPEERAYYNLEELWSRAVPLVRVQ